MVKVFRTPVSGQGGGSIWTQHQKQTFLNKFSIEIWVTGKVLKKKKNTNRSKKSGVQYQNGGQ